MRCIINSSYSTGTYSGSYPHLGHIALLYVQIQSLAAFHLIVLRQTLAGTPDFPYLRPPKHKTHYAS